MTLNPSRNTLTLAIHTPRVLILTTSRAHNTPWQHNTRNTEGWEEIITLVYRTIWNQYKCNHIPLLENPKLWCECSNLESTLSQLKNSNLILLLVWKHKQNIYIFQRLVKAFNEGEYSIGNHLKHIQPSKHNFVRIFKETTGWNHETTDCLVWQLSQPDLNNFQPFQKLLRVKQPVDSTKQQLVFTYFEKYFISKGFKTH